VPRASDLIRGVTIVHLAFRLADLPVSLVSKYHLFFSDDNNLIHISLKEPDTRQSTQCTLNLKVQAELPDGTLADRPFESVQVSEVVSTSATS
jgi:hypothetical protein